MAYGVLRKWEYLNYLVETINPRIEKDLKLILMLGSYQFVFLKTPPHAVVNETVEASKSVSRKYAPVVNAVMRKIVQRGKKIKIKAPTEEEKLSIELSLPLWLVKKISKDWKDQEIAEEVLQSLNTELPIHLRVNSLKIKDRKELIDYLKKENPKASLKEGKLPHLIEAWKLRNPARLQAYRNGLITVQDASSQQVVLLLEPKPQENIWDVASAPGGKATYIAELSRDRAKILATDINPGRINLIKSNAGRLGLNSIETKVVDASSTEEVKYLPEFDKVLLDAPCSSLGTLPRHPEEKFLRTPSHIKKITHLQEKLIENASKKVKPGGKLLYSVCTITREETIDLIANFLKYNSEFEAVKIEKNTTGKVLESAGESGPKFQFWFNLPPKGEGFFAVLLQRKIG